MGVEFKLVSYKEPIKTKEQEMLFTRKRNYTAYFSTVANFVYDFHTKIIYEALSCENYREVRHELILSYNGFDFTDIEPENFIRFEFNTKGCYTPKYQYCENYRYSELGIAGLQFSGLYYDFPKYQKRAADLKSYDLDIIESYIEIIKKEQEQIRQTEINLNLPKVHRIRHKRNFNVNNN